jgi:hypothetical protein
MANDDSHCAMRDADSVPGDDKKPPPNLSGDKKDCGATSTSMAEGALVWAKLKGFPHWPAVVTVDPMDAIAVKPAEGRKAVARVHVHFLAYENLRAWIKETKIMEVSQSEYSLSAILLRPDVTLFKNSVALICIASWTVDFHCEFA